MGKFKKIVTSVNRTFARLYSSTVGGWIARIVITLTKILVLRVLDLIEFRLSGFPQTRRSSRLLCWQLFVWELVLGPCVSRPQMGWIGEIRDLVL